MTKQEYKQLSHTIRAIARERAMCITLSEWRNAE